MKKMIMKFDNKYNTCKVALPAGHSACFEVDETGDKKKWIFYCDKCAKDAAIKDTPKTDTPSLSAEDATKTFSLESLAELVKSSTNYHTPDKTFTASVVHSDQDNNPPIKKPTNQDKPGTLEFYAKHAEWR